MLASAPEIAVPAELQAAVFVPAAPSANWDESMRQIPTIPAPAPPPEAPAPRASSPRLTPEPPSRPPPLPRASSPELPKEAPPFPRASSPELPPGTPPSEPTAAFATVAFDVPNEVVRPRRRFRTRSVLTVTAIGLATGFGLALLIGRHVETKPAAAALVPPPTVEPVSANIERHSGVEPRAKAAEITAAAAPKSLSVPPAESAEPAEVPISSAASVPSCREMLGNAFVEANDPKASLAETQIGNRELVRGKVHESQTAFCKAAFLDGAKVERWLNLAQLFLIRRDGKQAAETAARALELDPKNSRALEILGDASASLGKLQQARKAYLASEQRPEPDADALKWLVRRDLDEANRSVKARDFVRAERLFRRVVVFDPEHVVATIGVASCLRKLDEATAADAWTHRAEMLAGKARTGSAG